MDYYFFNTDGKSIDGPPRFRTLIKKGLAVTSGDRKYGEYLGRLVPGDTLLMYENRIGVVAVGTVLKRWDGKSYRDHIYYRSGDELDDQGHEYRIKVKWFLDVSENPIGLPELRQRLGIIPPKTVQKIVKGKTEVGRLIAERLNGKSARPLSQIARVSDVGSLAEEAEDARNPTVSIVRMTFAEVASILERLPAIRDDRAPPDGLRRGQFRSGWEDATVRNEVYRDETLNRLTWHNLGYRFGKAVGLCDAEQIDKVFDHLTQLYQGIRPDGLVGLPGEFADESPLVEGAACRVIVNTYERNREAVRRCKAILGTSCVICHFDFGMRYGPEFAGFIHVHHLRLLSRVGGEYVVDPGTDLCPVCPNCHAVIHHGGRLRSIEEVAQLLEQREQA